MKWLGLTTIIGMAMTISGVANAADLPVAYKASPPVQAYNWTGCYVGAGGGYGMWNQDSYVTAAGTTITVPTTNGGSGGFGKDKRVATINLPRRSSAQGLLPACSLIMRAEAFREIPIFRV